MHFWVGNFQHRPSENTTPQIPVDKTLDVEWQPIVPAQKIELPGHGLGLADRCKMVHQGLTFLGGAGLNKGRQRLHCESHDLFVAKYNMCS